MATKRTASELYDQRREDVARVMDWIALELDRHQAAAKKEPRDFGYAGDLGHILEKLTQALAFLSNREPEEIEALLGECR